MPHAPSVGDSQLSSSNRMSCWRGSMPQASRLCEVDLLDLVGRRLEDHLELVVLEQAVRVLAEAAVVGPPRRLHVGHVPVPRSEHAQHRLPVRRAGADLEVERLLDQASVRGPEGRELEDQILKRHDPVLTPACRMSRNTRDDLRSFSRCIRISVPVNTLQLPQAPTRAPRDRRAPTAGSGGEPQKRERLARQPHASRAVGPSAARLAPEGVIARHQHRGAAVSRPSAAPQVWHASSDGYTPCRRSSQYSKYRASGSMRTPAPIASTTEDPRR